MGAILNSAILNSTILNSAILVFPLKLTHTCQDWFPPFAQKKLHSFIGSNHLHKKTSLIHADSTWWWQPSWILPCWIQTPCFLLSDSLTNTLPPLWLWLKLIQSDSNSFILTQLDDGSHLEFCHLKFHHLRFSHLSFSSQTHSHLPRLVPTICTKQNLHSFILTQLDDGSHLEFCLLGFSPFLHIKNITHSCWLNLMMAAILNSAMLDSDTMFSSLRFTQKHSHSTLTLTQTNSICLTWWWQPTCIQPFCTKKTSLIHSDSTWWWQPSWILPCWIQTLPSWIQPSWFFPSNSLTLTKIGSHHLHKKNFTHSFWLNLMMAAILDSAILHKTLTQTNSIWVKLIHSHSTWWWRPSLILPS